MSLLIVATHSPEFQMRWPAFRVPAAGTTTKDENLTNRLAVITATLHRNCDHTAFVDVWPTLKTLAKAGLSLWAL